MFEVEVISLIRWQLIFLPDKIITDIECDRWIKMQMRTEDHDWFIQIVWGLIVTWLIVTLFINLTEKVNGVYGDKKTQGKLLSLNYNQNGCLKH